MKTKTKAGLQSLKWDSWLQRWNTLGWTAKETKTTKRNKNRTYIGQQYEI